MVARTKVARTRLTPEEHARLEGLAAEAGVSTSEYMRTMIVGPSVRDLGERVEALERRVLGIENALAAQWKETG